MPVIDVGNGWESRTYYCQPYVVSFIALLFFNVVPRIVRPGPPQTLTGASSTYYVPFAVCSLIFAARCFLMILCRIKFRWMSSFPKYWNGLIYH
jgi:hypothetical protein